MIELDEDGDYESLRIGTLSVMVVNDDGKMSISIHDHMEMMVDGEHKGDVDITFTSGEFGANFNHVGERKFWDRFFAP